MINLELDMLPSFTVARFAKNRKMSVISINICEQYLLDLFFPGANREAVAYS
jgi:hypothetical protein